MSQLIVHGGARVLTSVQLAESYNTNAKIINRNFSRNQDQFIEGEHYFQLTGETLKAFKAERPDDASLKFASSLNLWTEKGAWLHASFLKGKRAKEVFTALVDSYYNILEAPPQPIMQQGQAPLAITLEDYQQLESRVTTLEDMLKQQVTLHSGEQSRLRAAVGERVHALAKDKGARPALFRAIYSAIKERYKVGSYRDVKQHELQDALKFVATWEG
ncbi:ORF6N domain-containing protein [Lysinibacillus capsici]|uniref:ORF6N domain-containing protein n=1 Tax=Lysinibacillus capsici TaxID=2115968 RepID=UPI002E1BA22C|nr:ORF6N domain-containing protein [Lysinibacillus capsici]